MLSNISDDPPSSFSFIKDLQVCCYRFRSAVWIKQNIIRPVIRAVCISAVIKSVVPVPVWVVSKSVSVYRRLCTSPNTGRSVTESGSVQFGAVPAAVAPQVVANASGNDLDMMTVDEFSSEELGSPVRVAVSVTKQNSQMRNAHRLDPDEMESLSEQPSPLSPKGHFGGGRVVFKPANVPKNYM